MPGFGDQLSPAEIQQVVDTHGRSDRAPRTAKGGEPMAGVIVIVVVVVLIVTIVLKSFHSIGPTEVGLVTKRFAFSKLPDDNPIAFRGEAGYQANLLMPGLRFKLWLLYAVEKHPWVQVRAGEIGVVVAQVGEPLPIGAKSAEYSQRSETYRQLPRSSSRPADRKACSAPCCRRAASCRFIRSPSW